MTEEFKKIILVMIPVNVDLWFFTDDIVLVAAIRKSKICNEAAMKCGLNVHLEKAQYMKNIQEQRKKSMNNKLKNKIIEHTRKYKYVTTVINKKRNIED